MPRSTGMNMGTGNAARRRCLSRALRATIGHGSFVLVVAQACLVVAGKK